MNFLSREPTFRAALLVLSALGLIAGLMLPATTWLSGQQDADGALTALISTQKLTWYFWGQDRLLNLLPALAAPFRDPQVNLHVQVFFRAALAFLSPLGVVCLFRASWKVGVLVVALAQFVLALSLTSSGAFNMWVQHNPCGTSLVLFALATWLFRCEGLWRQALGIVMLFLAYAVNLALVTWSLPFIALAWVFSIRERRWLLVLAAMNVAAVVVAAVHARCFGETVTTFSLHPSLESVLAGYRSLASAVDVRILGVLFVAAVAAAIYRRSRAVFMALLVAVGMIAGVGALSCLDWLQHNDYHMRYFLTFLTVFVSCCAYVIVSALPLVSQSIPAQAGGAAVLGLAMLFGPLHGLAETPSALIAPAWRTSSEAIAETALHAHASLIVGDFWEVWPAVLVARTKLHRSGHAEQPLYGVAFRSHVLRKKLGREFERQPEGVLVLCIEASVEACAKTANFFGQLARPVAPVPSSVRALQINGHTAYLVLLRPSA